MTTPAGTISVNSEIGSLQRVLVHSPDSGLGKVVPSKAQDWLFEDIVHLDTIRRKEYDFYTKILLYFLDPGVIRGRLAEIDDPLNDYHFYKPEHPGFHASDKVVELQLLLAQVLENEMIRHKLVASVCAIENCSYALQDELIRLDGSQLAKVFISGTSNDLEMLFPPVPNFIFTRDIGIVINDHLLLNKPAKMARTREALLVKYIVYNHPMFAGVREKIIELPNVSHHFLLPGNSDDKKVTLEGGDIMVMNRDHLLIGISERTTMEAAHQCINILFERKIVKKVSIIRIPKKRDYMHIDTIFTQVRRDVWVLLGSFSKKASRMEDADPVERILETGNKDNKIRIIQFRRKDPSNPTFFDNLEELLTDISMNDLGSSSKPRFIYSGNNQFPYDAREQWTDSCNLLALKEGVVLGYDRNDKTVDAFRDAGFQVIHVHDLIRQLESGETEVSGIKDTLITMPSAELSRARGGFHCMSMPMKRAEID